MAENTGTKRKSGQVKGEKWLVLTESTGEPGVGFRHNCGAEIMAQRVTHPIWDGPFACSGSGRCSSEEVPYCPQCEEQPNCCGEPIIPKGSYHHP
ncbi:MAG: hypothetical protein WCT16_02070 [Candidatus Buchananbacteria bacterium]